MQLHQASSAQPASPCLNLNFVAAVPAMVETAAEQPLQGLETQIPSARELDSLVAPLEQPRQQQSPAGALQQQVAFPPSVFERPVLHQSPAGSSATAAGSEASASGGRLPQGGAPAENGLLAHHKSQQQVVGLSDASPASRASSLGHLGAQQRASVLNDSLPASRASSLESWRSSTSQLPSADLASSLGLAQLTTGQLTAAGSGVLHAGRCRRLAQQTRPA